MITAAAWIARRYGRAWHTGPLRAVDMWAVFEFRTWALQVTRTRPDIRPGNRRKTT